MRDLRIAVVVDVIPMVLGDTQPILSALDGEIEQLVMISSSDVYANYELLQRRRTGTPEREAVVETSALRRTRYPYRGAQPRDRDDPDRFLDDYDKIPIESAIRELSCPWTILRLPMVYGPGDKQKRFRWAIAPMLAGEASLRIPALWASWQSSYGFIDNVGAAIAAALGNERALNQTFNIAEERHLTQLQWAQRLASSIDWNGNIELIDDPEDPFQSRLANLDLQVPFKISGSKLRRELKCSEIVSETIALERTIESEKRE